jgi:hypothetical protein
VRQVGKLKDIRAASECVLASPAEQAGTAAARLRRGRGALLRADPRRWCCRSRAVSNGIVAHGMRSASMQIDRQFVVDERVVVDLCIPAGGVGADAGGVVDDEVVVNTVVRAVSDQDASDTACRAATCYPYPELLAVIVNPVVAHAQALVDRAVAALRVELHPARGIVVDVVVFDDCIMAARIIRIFAADAANFQVAEKAVVGSSLDSGVPGIAELGVEHLNMAYAL